MLLAGGAGYVGSHTALALLDAGYEVVVLDDLSTGHRQAVAGVTVLEADVADRLSLARALEGAGKFDALLHFAARTRVDESMLDPALYFRVNVSGTLNLLDAALARGVRRFVFSSSAAVYGDPERVPIRETHPLVPTSPYGQSKQVVESLLPWYERAYGLKWVSLRYFNAAGADPQGRSGEDHHPETHLIPSVLLCALGRRGPVSVFGTDWPTPDGTCIRDFVHVSDLADAHRLALEYLARGGRSGVFNLGSGQGFSVREVIDLCRRVTGVDIPVQYAPRRAGDPAVLVAACDRARAELGWVPRYPSLQAMVETAWAWHRTHPGGFAGAAAAGASRSLEQAAGGDARRQKPY